MNIEERLQEIREKLWEMEEEFILEIPLTEKREEDADAEETV